jgi:hypothetical protein
MFSSIQLGSGEQKGGIAKSIIDGLSDHPASETSTGPAVICQVCQGNSIAIRGGFIYDGTMDTSSDRFPDPNKDYLDEFVNQCQVIDISTDQEFESVKERVRDDCVGWVPSGKSLIAQHPYDTYGADNNEYVQFVLSYSNVFEKDARVMFKYRAARKENMGRVNGVFRFLIDGVPEQSIEVNESVFLSDNWFEAIIGIPPGPHKLDWVYRKLNRPGISEDLSAEIEVI